MLLYSRGLVGHGSPMATAAYALEASAWVNANSSLDTTCWAGGIGYPYGSFVLAAFVESQAALFAAQQEMLANPDFEAMTTRGPVAQRIDNLGEVVYGEPTEPAPVGAMCVVTTATALGDKIPEAVAWSADLAMHVESVTGHPVGVTIAVYGTFGGIGFISTAPDAGAMDEARAKLSANATYATKMQAAGDLFVPGTALASQLTRIG